MFGGLVKHFKREFGFRVSIRRTKMPKRYFGWTRKELDGSFTIRIDRALDDSAQTLALIHEMAHVVGWDADTHRSDHGPRFGMAYAKVWRSYLTWINS